MQILKKFKYKCSIYILLFLCAACSANSTFSNEVVFQKNFEKKFDFLCSNPYQFFLSIGIDLEKDVIELSKLQKYEKKRIGISNGAIYRDRQQIYYVKQSNPVIELLSSRLMNLLLGTKCTPIVKPVRDSRYTIASLELPNFKTKKKVKKTNKIIIGEADLAIAQALLGIVDQNRNNMGYVQLNSTTLLAARVDFDTSFDYISNLQGRYNLSSNYLNLKHLHLAVMKYPEQDVINAIKKITDVSNVKIIMTICRAWATLIQTGYILPLEPCLELANQIIERKNAFQQTLKDQHCTTYKLMKKTHHKKNNVKQRKLK